MRYAQGITSCNTAYKNLAGVSAPAKNGNNTIIAARSVFKNRKKTDLTIE